MSLQRYAEGMNNARKAMIIVGLSLSTYGLWEVRQLTLKLQRIVLKHKTVFDAAQDDFIGQ